MINRSGIELVGKKMCKENIEVPSETSLHFCVFPVLPGPRLVWTVTSSL